MAFPWHTLARPVGITNRAGDKMVDIITDGGGTDRLAVDIGGASVVVGAVELDDGGGGGTRAQVHEDATAFNAAGFRGSQLMAGRDDTGPTHRDIRVNTSGQLQVEIVSGDIQIGAVELKDSATTDRAMIRSDGDAIPADPDDGALMIAGREDGGPSLKHIRVDAGGVLRQKIEDETTTDRARVLPDGTALAAADANGLLMAGWDEGPAQLRALRMEAWSVLGTALGSALRTKALVHGFDGTQLPGSEVAPVEARPPSSDANVGQLLRGLLTNARQAIFDRVANNFIVRDGVNSVSATVTNPLAGAVIASLDTRNLTHKSVFVESTAASTLRIQVSRDGATWRDLGPDIALAASTAFASTNQQEVMKGYRHIRIIDVAGTTGDVTAEIVAQQ